MNIICNVSFFKRVFLNNSLYFYSKYIHSHNTFSNIDIDSMYDCRYFFYFNKFLSEKLEFTKPCFRPRFISLYKYVHFIYNITVYNARIFIR